MCLGECMGKSVIQATPDTCEELTDELLERLLASASPEAYLLHTKLDNRSLSDYLLALIDAKGLTRADVVRRSKINSTFAYQLFGGKRQAGRDNAIRLALAIGCTLDEAQCLLRYAGHSELWCKNRRDAIIIFCIDRGYTLDECDDELYRLGEDTLVPEDG